MAITSKNYIVKDSDSCLEFYCVSDITVSLYDATNTPDKEIIFKKNDSSLNAVTISDIYTLTKKNDYATIKSINNEWVLIDTNNNIQQNELSRFLWTPDSQDASDDIATGNTVSTYENLWEGLRSEHPTYISRESLGKDNSDTYDVWKYTFEPTYYKKTLLVVSNLHGSEKEGQKLFYLFMNQVCNNWTSHPSLAWIRNNVRIVCIPIANPRGIVINGRQNGNGVDLNRNFTYGWDDWVNTGEEQKGTSELSEVEAQYIYNLMDAFKDDPNLIGYIDCHNTESVVASENESNYLTYIPSYTKAPKNFVREIMQQCSPYGYTINKIIGRHVKPTSANEATNTFNINAINIEWKPGAIYNKLAGTSEDMTEGLKFMGNMIIEFCKQEDQRFTTKNNAFCVQQYNSFSLHTTSDTSYGKDPYTDYTFTPPCDGILEVTCDYTYYNSTTSANCYFAIGVTQANNSPITSSNLSANLSANEVYQSSENSRMSITCSAKYPVLGADDSIGSVNIALYNKVNGGTLTQMRSRMYITFTPVDSGLIYEKYYTTSGGVVTKTNPPTVD